MRQVSKVSKVSKLILRLGRYQVSQPLGDTDTRLAVMRPHVDRVHSDTCCNQKPERRTGTTASCWVLVGSGWHGVGSY